VLGKQVHCFALDVHNDLTCFWMCVKLFVPLKLSMLRQMSAVQLRVCDFVQVKLVRVAGKEGEQVYIQIGDDEMEMLTQQQAEQVRAVAM